MRKLNIFYTLFFLGFIFFIFRNWFLAPQIIGGDWPYLFPEMLRDPSIYFSSWNPGQGNGLGGINPVYSLGMFFGFTVFLAHTFSIPWVFIYKFFWFALPLLFGILSSIYLVKTIFPQSALWQKLLASFIFTVNTYFLMVVGGGQMGVALSYSVAPLVLARFIKLINYIVVSNKNFQFSIFNFQLALLAGLVLAIQVMFDPRIAYITMIAVAIYVLLNSKRNRLNVPYLILYTFIIPGLIAGLLHAVWILPILFLQSSPIPQSLTNVDGFRFFSFADFSNTFSMLHPNWPENIFGKTYFMKSEFMLLPIIAYSSLLFLSYKSLKHAEQNAERRGILFFALLGLIGAFLAKGANEPFSSVNIWLFDNIPGFAMFRDPTKFYILVVLSYSVLIPFSLWQFVKIVSSIKHKVLSIHNTYYIIPATFLVFWAFLIHPAIFGQLGGTFREREVQVEYIRLKDFLYNQPGFFRTLWIPRQHRFTYNFWSRMPVEAQPLLKKAKIMDIVSELRKPERKEYLSDLGIKYVIVPYDPNGEIFIKDRKYDPLAYQQTVRQLEAIPWLKKIDGFGKIAVFETPTFKDYFWLTGDGSLTYDMVNVTNYNISVSINHPQRLVFAENYNPYWVMKINSRIVRSEKTLNGLNSFILEKGKYSFEIVFLQDKFYIYGRIISVATFAAVLLFLWKYRKHVFLPK